MKRMIVTLLALVLLLSTASALSFTAGAAVEGDWTASRAADDYNDPDSYRPYSGYKYELDKGLVLVSADYTNNTPYRPGGKYQGFPPPRPRSKDP